LAKWKAEKQLTKLRATREAAPNRELRNANFDPIGENRTMGHNSTAVHLVVRERRGLNEAEELRLK
jgi:hypothetical protein